MCTARTPTSDWSIWKSRGGCSRGPGQILDTSGLGGLLDGPMALSLLKRFSSPSSHSKRGWTSHEPAWSLTQRRSRILGPKKWLENRTVRLSVRPLLNPQTQSVSLLAIMATDTSTPVIDEPENNETHLKLIAKLETSGVTITKSHHKAVKTSEEAAQVRGFPLGSGAKAIVMSVKVKSEGGDKAQFALFVMSAARKLDSKKAKKLVPGCKSMSFATPEQVKTLTGCIPGAVPPFGSLWDIQTYMDTSLRTVGETIDFNAGLRTDSVKMRQDDYEKVELPVISEFTSAPEEK